MSFKQRIEERIVILYTYKKSVTDRNIIEVCRNEIIFLEDLLKEYNPVKMKFIDAPVGARFMFLGENISKDIYIKINSNADGLIVKWNGNVEGHQSNCCWVDKENGYDLNTEIQLI